MAKIETDAQVAPATTKRKIRPRPPSRERGIQRYAEIVDATEALLLEHSPDDIGLYAIAKRANAPHASVYHFFPTKDAAFLALAQRYLDGFASLAREPVLASALASWQTLMAWDFRLSMGYYNVHTPALKLFLGGFGGVDTRQANRQWNERAANATYQRFDRVFHMPFVRNAGKKFHVNIEILDAIYSISYLKHGVVTEEYYQEAVEACTAYCRLFLPEHVELRDEFIGPVRRGDAVLIEKPVLDDKDV